MRDDRFRVDDGWNHSIHYHPVVLKAIPDVARRALDVGCGEGLLARRLRERIPHVVGIDRHEASIARSVANGPPDIEYILGDFMTHPFEAESFDFASAVASLHHVDTAEALKRMGRLLRPGGRLAVVGLARSRPVDLPIDVAGLVVHRAHTRSRPAAEDGSPRVSPAPLTYGQTRRAAARALPRSRYRRRLLWRYTVVWEKPQ